MKNTYKKRNELFRIFSALLVVCLFSFCVENANSNNEKLYFIYKNAIQLEDYETAIQVVHELLYYDSNNINHYDTLVQLYHKTGNDKSTLATLDYLLDYVTDERNLVIGANSSIALNNTEKAKEFMEILSNTYSDSLLWTYKLAILNYNLNDDNESLANFQKVINNKQSKIENIDIAIDNKKLSVPLYSASKNTMGIIYSRNGYNKEAKVSFKEALRFSPEFFVAEENLLKVKEKLN